MRARRRAIPRAERVVCARQLTRHLVTHRSFLKARHIAAYLSNDGEMDIALTIARIWAMRKHCYLPVLRPNPLHGLRFARYTPESRLTPNRFGIPEPLINHHFLAQPWALDLVLVPLVAFDADGNRLGMGGGFYDRTFAYRRQRNYARPRLVGIAYEFQRVNQLPSRTWDVPLEAIVTEFGWHQVPHPGMHSRNTDLDRANLPRTGISG